MEYWYHNKVYYIRDTFEYPGGSVQKFNPISEKQRIFCLYGFIQYTVIVIRSKWVIIAIFVFVIFFLIFEKFFPSYPEITWLLSFDVLVQWILNLSFTKIRKSSSDHDEQNDTHWEYICTLTPIILFLQYFWCLILSCPYLWMVNTESIFALFAGRKTKISNFQVVSRIKKDIFRFEVSMHYSSSIMKIFNRT